MHEHSQFNSSLMDLIAEVEDMVQPQPYGPGLGGSAAGQHGPPSGRQGDWGGMPARHQLRPKLGSKDCKQSSDVPGVGSELLSCCLCLPVP